MYQNFIGIDIGKADFFVAVYQQDKVNNYPNDEAGFNKFYAAYERILKAGIVILETTGGYEMALIRHLQNRQCAVHRANTRKVKHFIRSYGQLGKSDTIDALGLAHYGSERHENLPLFEKHEHVLLLKLTGRRRELKQTLAQEKNRLQAPEKTEIRSSYATVIKALNDEIAAIDNRIDRIFEEDKTLDAKKKVIKTIVGIGDIIATDLLSLMPELGRLNRKQIASLGGLAPHPNESGKKVGYRRVRGGRKEIKSVLFMAAMSASRSNSALGKAYKKFIARGKKKMVAQTALMRKILVIANAKMRDYYLEQEGDVEVAQ